MLSPFVNFAAKLGDNFSSKQENFQACAALHFGKNIVTFVCPSI